MDLKTGDLGVLPTPNHIAKKIANADVRCEWTFRREHLGALPTPNHIAKKIANADVRCEWTLRREHLGALPAPNHIAPVSVSVNSYISV